MGTPWRARECVGRNVGRPPSGVKARRVELPEAVLIGVERRLRDFHDARPVGPENGGPDASWPGKYACRRTAGMRQAAEGRHPQRGRARRAAAGWSCSRRSAPNRRRAASRSILPVSRSAGPLPSGRGTSAAIATSARLSGPNSAANAGSRSTASVSATIALRAARGSASPRAATNASAAACQPDCGCVGRCSSRAWISVPRRKRLSSASAIGLSGGGSA